MVGSSVHNTGAQQVRSHRAHLAAPNATRFPVVDGPKSRLEVVQAGRQWCGLNRPNSPTACRPATAGLGSVRVAPAAMSAWSIYARPPSPRPAARRAGRAGAHVRSLGSEPPRGSAWSRHPPHLKMGTFSQHITNYNTSERSNKTQRTALASARHSLLECQPDGQVGGIPQLLVAAPA